MAATTLLRPVIQLVSTPLITLVVAGLAIAGFNGLKGGDATFRQVYAIVAHSTVVLLALGLFSLPLDYVRETMVSPTNLAVFAPLLDDGTFPARLLGAVDLFYVWWGVSLAVGFGVLYRRRTGPDCDHDSRDLRGDCRHRGGRHDGDGRSVA